jgi:hypothetical protein
MLKNADCCLIATMEILHDLPKSAYYYHRACSSVPDVVTGLSALLAFAACSAVSYGLLWCKPQDAKVPAYIIRDVEWVGVNFIDNRRTSNAA